MRIEVRVEVGPATSRFGELAEEVVRAAGATLRRHARWAEEFVDVRGLDEVLADERWLFRIAFWNVEVPRR